jgi:Dirigent-like protein
VLVRADGQLMIPVVAGSGKYKGVTGFVTIGPGKRRALNTYDLTLPGANVAAFRVPALATAKVTIKVTSVSVSVKPTDVAPRGTSRGDTIEYRDRLLNAKGAVVGSDHGTMTFTSAHTATFAGVARLPGGSVRLVGKVIALPNKSFAIPVAGGTGRFAKAKGYVLVGPGEKRALNTFTLTLLEIPVA